MLYNIHLQTFADGGGEAGGEGQNAAGDGFAEQFEKQFGRKPGAAAPEARANKTEPKEEKTDGDAGQDAAADEEPQEAENPDAEFEKLIKGKFKDAYGRKAQAMINDRFKNHNQKLAEAEQKVADLTEAMRPYLQKLGVDPNDLEAVKTAVMEDKSNFRAAAVEKGITIEEAIKAYQDERKTERDAEELQRRQELIAQRQQEAADMQILEGWQKEAEEIRKDDPDFDLMQELETNEEFRNMVNAHVSVKNAYRATHYEQNMAKVAGAVERQTALNTAQRISAGQRRPAEGGLTANAAARQTRTDYNNLSAQDIMSIFNKSLTGK